jgi:hypothetical protein
MKSEFFLIFLYGSAMILLSACSTGSSSVHSYSEQPLTSGHNAPVGKRSESKWTLEHPPAIGEISEAVRNDTASQQLEHIGEWWFFGPGIGYSILNIGTAIVFPPYALYLLGNAGLALAGEEPVKIINILPEAPRSIVNTTLDEICSVPGRITSAVARKPYHDNIVQEPDSQDNAQN